MAKYDWLALEKEFLTSDYKSVSAFLKSKGINRTGAVNKQVKEWKNKRAKKEQKKSKKTIEKIIEIESSNEAKKMVDLKDLANDLAMDIIQARTELNKYIAKKKKKKKKIEYDYKNNKPSKEIVEETEEIIDYESIIDRKGLKELTSALKDLNEIMKVDNPDNNDKKSLSETIQLAYEKRIKDGDK